MPRLPTPPVAKVQPPFQQGHPAPYWLSPFPTPFSGVACLVVGSRRAHTNPWHHRCAWVPGSSWYHGISPKIIDRSYIRHRYRTQRHELAKSPIRAGAGKSVRRLSSPGGACHRVCVSACYTYISSHACNTYISSHRSSLSSYFRISLPSLLFFLNQRCTQVATP